METPPFTLHTRAFSSRPVTARSLCNDVPYVSPDADNAEVMALFTSHKLLISLPVVEQRRPFGMINRHIFLSQMSRPFFRELYDRKSCIAFMDKNPLLIEADSQLESVARQMVASGDKSVTDGFMITDNGEYLGMGLGIDVIRTVSDLQARQHQQIMQSIEYARVIQEAMLDKSQQTMANQLRDWCLMWQPRDCVGGDFYAFHHYGHGWLMVMADCTGHGVPGAFMTVILSSALEKALANCEPDRPERLLQHINLAIKQTLGQFNQSQQTSLSNDGCDAMALFVDTQQHRLVWAGGRLSGFLLSADSENALLLDSERVGIGYTDTPVDYCWTRHELALKAEDIFFIWTDGLTDQIGGERRIMFGRRRIRMLLEAQRHQPMKQLCQSLQETWLAWQGDEARRDDMSWFGFRY
ncbi:protein-serine/threonine phosphatase [Erwinia sp. OLTSP20]|uniref:SpoIIE family protein phosphatase n=1 Tax=unclassified Erwinia TaxID=2622719 RepID=UPI000C17A7EB|nr:MULTISPECIES: SpoIIE family protein phosphatase [unclassified Erwinia]PIJ48885.1 protein-serine/threonine phosphatase [Erwinia sp. OAMSP11]PIJ74538.1 protein-serine/threonine phosphatase [Erwinia sp. OLSSP12]PIJ79569.1 protein-serine/threonine phosphatase [Erwinia sp. OLCASP19]PIJ80354.1 protein-serine/threonine phosphatase [Erwinia sp. OLMTSP26]PIJ82469.1 protein-serine/threonine phosphatase [Erwinia sp. OLMDSP33]